MKKGVGASLWLVLSVGASRIFLGGTSAPISDNLYGTRAHTSSDSSTPTKETTLARYVECAAYSPERNSKTFPKVPEGGGAYSLIDTFLGGELTSSLGISWHLRFAIALVPDPIHTELGVMFDRKMVAIQAAAQDEGYNYQSSWLPWSSEVSSFSNLADTQRLRQVAAASEACPGVLLFRRRTLATGASDPFSEGLMVMVVGEQPTGGINQDQWENALLWLSSLNGAGLRPSGSITGPKTFLDVSKGLRILGPTFTGSIDALIRHLGPEQSARTFFKGLPIQVLSGAVSSITAIYHFKDVRKGISFGSFQ